MVSDFDTMHLPGVPDAVAPDGSDVRVLLQLSRGSMAHFELAAGRVSRPVAHHHVEELWYILNGRGEMYRRQGDTSATVPLRPGTCLSIPAGTHFQFRTLGTAPLRIVIATTPPWPGEEEAVRVEDYWRVE